MEGIVTGSGKLKIYRYAMDVIEGKLNISEFALLVGKSYRQAQRIVSRIKDGADRMHPREYGQVELDESYFGARRTKGKRGRGAVGKTVVFGLKKCGGGLYPDHKKLLQKPNSPPNNGKNLDGRNRLHRRLQDLRRPRRHGLQKALSGSAWQERICQNGEDGKEPHQRDRELLGDSQGKACQIQGDRQRYVLYKTLLGIVRK